MATMLAVSDVRKCSDLTNMTELRAFNKSRQMMEMSLKERSSDDDILPMHAAPAPSMPDKAARAYWNEKSLLSTMLSTEK